MAVVWSEKFNWDKLSAWFPVLTWKGKPKGANRWDQPSKAGQSYFASRRCFSSGCHMNIGLSETALKETGIWTTLLSNGKDNWVKRLLNQRKFIPFSWKELLLLIWDGDDLQRAVLNRPVLVHGALLLPPPESRFEPYSIAQSVREREVFVDIGLRN